MNGSRLSVAMTVQSSSSPASLVAATPRCSQLISPPASPSLPGARARRLSLRGVVGASASPRRRAAEALVESVPGWEPAGLSGAPIIWASCFRGLSAPVHWQYTKKGVDNSGSKQAARHLR